MKQQQKLCGKSSKVRLYLQHEELKDAAKR